MSSKGDAEMTTKRREARKAILKDLRDRRFLKWLYADDPDNVGAYGYLDRALDVEVQHEMVDKWVNLVMGIFEVEEPAEDTRLGRPD